MIDYFKDLSVNEKITYALNSIWSIFSFLGLVHFRKFYKTIKSEYGDIYSLSNALKIVSLSEFKWLLLLGLLIIILTFFCVFFTFKSIFNSISLVSSKVTFIIWGIINCILTARTLNYYILGIVIVSIIAAFFSLSSS